MSRIYKSIDQLIGNTPLLELTRIEKKFGLEARLLAKLEYLNPAGSAKDRIAKKMIDDAEQRVKMLITNEDGSVSETDLDTVDWLTDRKDLHHD